jgi:TonB-linked SusC/RagA family outer membrane protein
MILKMQNMNVHIANRFLLFGLLFILSVFDGLAQNQSITGIIKNTGGVPVQKAAISILENPGVVVYSDQDGKFVINGKIGEHVKVTDPDLFHKTLKITDNNMVITIEDKDGLVPVGYGLKVSKEEMTMAVGMANSDKLTRSTALNPANSLYGQITGLEVMQNGGLPWETNPTLFLRGVGTTLDRSILILVDGFERSINTLSMDEIESVVMLKDAASLALYGLRGANGVLLVTTKTTGINQTRKISVGFERGITQATRLPHFLNAYDFAQRYNEGLSNDGLPLRYSQAELNGFKSGSNSKYFPNVDWLKESLGNYGSNNKLNISINGGNKSLRYFTLLNYQDDNGLLKPVDVNSGYSTQFIYKKINLRTNIDVNLTPSTKLAIRLGGMIERTNQPASSSAAIMSAIYNIPSAAFPVKYADGNYGGTDVYGNNPVALIASTGYRKAQNRDLQMNVRLEQKLDVFLKGLLFEAAFADNNYVGNTDSWTQTFQYERLKLVMNTSGAITDSVKTIYSRNSTLGFGSGVSNITRSRVILGNFKYAKDWGSNSINSTLLFQQEEKIGFNYTFLHQIIAGNAHYSKSGKYFADFSISYSGSNYLARGSRFGIFPALSGAWNISKEDWFAKDGKINDLKIRASWGMSGNDLIPLYPISNAYFRGAPIYPLGQNNQNLGVTSSIGNIAVGKMTFETSYKSNIGIDARLFKKLAINLDAFYEIRKDILVPNVRQLSDIIGINRIYYGGGIVHNKGIEIDLNYSNSWNDFTYYFDGQFSYVKNKIVNIFEEKQPYEYLKSTGKSIGQAFGLQAIGFFKDLADINNSPTQIFSPVKPGDIKYKDLNSDGVINQLDYKPLGYSTINPEIYYSGTIGIKYKAFGLDALFQGVANYTRYENTPGLFWPLVGNTNISTFSDNRWTPATAATATLPRLNTIYQNVNNQRPNSIWLVDGSFLKLRSLNVYYTFSDKVISKLKLTNARVFLRGMNLFSLDHVKIVDPEALGAVYPILSSYQLGINIGF